MNPNAPKNLMPAHILGTGSYLPQRVVPNAELETNDHWIVTRTGMRERRMARVDEATSDMAGIASERALENAGVSAEDLGLIIVGTCTPDMLFPNTAAFVQRHLRAGNATCVDVEAACSGFLYAMEIARQFVMTGSQRRILVVGAEKMTSMTDYEDRSTCVLFGDAAGAAVMGPGGGRGVIHTVTGSEGKLAGLLKIPAGGSRFPATLETVKNRQHYIKMAGQEVFKNAVSHMSRCAQQVLEESGLKITDIKLIIPHQANARIIKAVGQRIGATQDQVYMNVDKYGNTSAASVIVALDETSRGGLLQPGDLVMIVVFGAGFTWGATVLEWGDGQ